VSAAALLTLLSESDRTFINTGTTSAFLIRPSLYTAFTRSRVLRDRLRVFVDCFIIFSSARLATAALSLGAIVSEKTRGMMRNKKTMGQNLFVVPLPG